MSSKKIHQASASFSFTLRVALRQIMSIGAAVLFLVLFWWVFDSAQPSPSVLGPVASATSAAGQVRMNSSIPGSQVIKHVVIIFQENRAPDNLFQDPVLIQEGADIQNYGLNTQGQKVPLQPVPLADYWDLGHSHVSFVAMYDDGKMDGANKIKQFCDPGHKCKKAPPNFQYAYVQAQDVEPYFHMAEKYTFADRMFQTNEGPSYPAHQFVLAGTSAPTATSNLFASEGPIGGPKPGLHTGCTGPPGQRVELIKPTGVEDQKMFPCFDHPTLGDLLDAQSLKWRFYSPALDDLDTAPNSIRHLRFGPDWKKDMVLGPQQILTDVAKGKLASVTWVIPTSPASDHPGTNDGEGPSWVSSVVNAIGKSEFWSSTAIFITWDDWGGWYDHVAPKVISDGKSWGSGYVYGFRVPLVVVSPYAQASYVSHVTHDFGSILKFTEEVFGLPSLGYADAYADDLADCFNFGQAPIEFREIPAPIDSQFFVNDRRPLLPPDND